MDCGETNPIVLEFDHQSDKKFNLGNAVNKAYALSRIKEEIANCEIRCANCHRKKTAQDVFREYQVCC